MAIVMHVRGNNDSIVIAIVISQGEARECFAAIDVT